MVHTATGLTGPSFPLVFADVAWTPACRGPRRAGGFLPGSVSSAVKQRRFSGTRRDFRSFHDEWSPS